MARRIMLLACAGILALLMSACGKSQEAVKHQVSGSSIAASESSVSKSLSDVLSEAEPEVPQDTGEIAGAVEQAP